MAALESVFFYFEFLLSDPYGSVDFFCYVGMEGFGVVVMGEKIVEGLALFVCS